MIGILRWFAPRDLVPPALAEADARMRQAEACEHDARLTLQRVRKTVDPRYVTPRTGEVERLASELDDADAAMRKALGDGEG